MHSTELRGGMGGLGRERKGVEGKGWMGCDGTGWDGMGWGVTDAKVTLQAQASFWSCVQLGCRLRSHLRAHLPRGNCPCASWLLFFPPDNLTSQLDADQVEPPGGGMGWPPSLTRTLTVTPTLNLIPGAEHTLLKVFLITSPPG